MAQEFCLKELCSTCGGTGIQPIPPPGEPISCFMCEGTGKRCVAKLYTEEDLATSANLLTMYNALNADIELIKTGVQAIWNKVKDQ